MNITLSKGELVEVSKLTKGECFRYGNNYHVVVDDGSNCTSSISAVNISNNTFGRFNPNTKVIPVEAKVVIDD